jgi:nitrite reductase (NADH) small subunit
MNDDNFPTTKWVSITRAEDIPLREGRSVQIAGHDIAVFNLGGRFLAVENKCPHRGGPLADGIVSGRTVVCPLHAWKVDLESGRVTNRAEENPCVKTFATAVRAGVLMLELAIPEGPPLTLRPSCMAQNAPQHPGMSGGDPGLGVR